MRKDWPSVECWGCGGDCLGCDLRPADVPEDWWVSWEPAADAGHGWEQDPEDWRWQADYDRQVELWEAMR